MSEHRTGKRIVSKDKHLVVTVIPASVNDPLSPEQVVQKNAQLFSQIPTLESADLTALARDELAREIRDATENVERRGGRDETTEVMWRP